MVVHKSSFEMHFAMCKKLFSLLCALPHENYRQFLLIFFFLSLLRREDVSFASDTLPWPVSSSSKRIAHRLKRFLFIFFLMFSFSPRTLEMAIRKLQTISESWLLAFSLKKSPSHSSSSSFVAKWKTNYESRKTCFSFAFHKCIKRTRECSRRRKK